MENTLIILHLLLLITMVSTKEEIVIKGDSNVLENKNGTVHGTIWTLSDVEVDMTVFQTPAEAAENGGKCPTYLMKESFVLGRIPPLTSKKKLTLVKAVSELLFEGRVMNISVTASSGNISWIYSGGDMVTLYLQPASYPTRIFITYYICDKWQKIDVPVNINPFPLYSYQLPDFAPYWLLRKDFDLTVPDYTTISHARIRTNIYDVSFTVEVPDDLVQVTADIYSSIMGSYSVDCEGKMENKIYRARCPVNSNPNGTSSIIALNLFFSTKFSHDLPGKCLDSFTKFANFNEHKTDWFKYLARKLFISKPWMLYIVLFSFEVGIVLISLHLATKSPDFLVVDQYVRFIFTVFVAIGVMTCVDTSYRMSMDSCYLFFDRTLQIDSIWYPHFILWLFYPTFIIFAMLIPSRIFAAAIENHFDNLMEYEHVAETVIEAMATNGEEQNPGDEKEPLKSKNDSLVEGDGYDKEKEKLMVKLLPQVYEIDIMMTSEKAENDKLLEMEQNDKECVVEVDWLTRVCLYVMCHLGDLSMLFGASVMCHLVGNGVAPVNVMWIGLGSNALLKLVTYVLWNGYNLHMRLWNEYN